MVAHGKPDGKNWHRRAVGPGPWREMGEHQLRFLVDNGLQPEHFFLEVGCGSLRAGVHIIEYLKTGHYFAIDNELSLLEAAQQVELVEHKLESKKPTFSLTSDFDLSFVPRSVLFDRVWAHSVFTHLSPELILRCLTAVRPRLAPEGVFFATFNEADQVDLSCPHGWRDELLTTRYPRRVIEGLALGVGMNVEFIGDWGTMENAKIAGVPGKRQQMIALRKE